MISILIPTYHYDCTELVSELVKQCLSSGVTYEIICQDDASNSEINKKNQTINTFPSCFFYTNEKNYGRSKNRNSLAQKSKYNWLLFMDCDTIPVYPNFIQNYVSVINTNTNTIFFGGIEYHSKKPEKECLLRWIYGKKREALPVDVRNKKKNFSALTSNLLIKKDLFLTHPFDEELTEYGYEDYAFFSALAKANQSVQHIENRCYHNGLETSVEFLEKTKIALQNLVLMYLKKNVLVNQNKLIKTHQKIVQLGLKNVVGFIFSLTEKAIEKNLISSSPSLILFDFYKLGWFNKLTIRQTLK